MREIPEDMMEALRGRYGLDDLSDTSRDEIILKMSPRQMFKERLAWEIGSTSWATDILLWLSDVGATVTWPDETY